jgi:kynurenine 3-monooxygenase
MDYHQEYIPHEYIELKMPAGRDSQGNATFLLDHNHLHIWPRHSFMLIALPNKVSRTATDALSNLDHEYFFLDRIKHLHAHYLHPPLNLTTSITKIAF